MPQTAVALGVTHCDVAPNHILYAANASLVALCCLSEKVSGRGGPVLLSQTPICHCVGLGEYRALPVSQPALRMSKINNMQTLPLIFSDSYTSQIQCPSRLPSCTLLTDCFHASLNDHIGFTLKDT